MLFLELIRSSAASERDARGRRPWILDSRTAAKRLTTMPTRRPRAGAKAAAPASAQDTLTPHVLLPQKTKAHGKNKKTNTIGGTTVATVSVHDAVQKLHKQKHTYIRQARTNKYTTTKGTLLKSPKPTARVYVLTYFFSSLTIDKQKLFNTIPHGWLGSTAAETLGLPICHSNVQLQSITDPGDIAEFGFEGGPREGTGVYQCAPGANPHLALCRQQKCFIGETSLSHEQLVEVIGKLETEWTAPRYHLLSKNCNHFVDALIRKLVVGKQAPAFINRGARLLCNFPIPGLNILPRMVSRYLPSGGSWTAGAVCSMAQEERQLIGVSDFHDWEDWNDDFEKEDVINSSLTQEKKTSTVKKTKSETRASSRDPLANHLTPVLLLGEHLSKRFRGD